jgi:ubiquitin carboxyl-terminal hydrolase 9/13
MSVRCALARGYTYALQAPSNPAVTTPIKKEEPTPLEKLLVNAGPLRGDGSDKFFGFENVSARNDCSSHARLLTP